VKNVKQFEQEFLTVLRNRHADVLAALKQGKIDDSITSVLEKVGAELAKSHAN
jgi:F-type H+-transporting ATPase subunit alpha